MTDLELFARLEARLHEPVTITFTHEELGVIGTLLALAISSGLPATAAPSAFEKCHKAALDALKEDWPETVT